MVAKSLYFGKVEWVGVKLESEITALWRHLFNFVEGVIDLNSKILICGHHPPPVSTFHEIYNFFRVEFWRHYMKDKGTLPVKLLENISEGISVRESILWSCG